MERLEAGKSGIKFPKEFTKMPSLYFNIRKLRKDIEYIEIKSVQDRPRAKTAN